MWKTERSSLIFLHSDVIWTRGLQEFARNCLEELFLAEGNVIKLRLKSESLPCGNKQYRARATMGLCSKEKPAILPFSENVCTEPHSALRGCLENLAESSDSSIVPPENEKAAA